MVGVEVTGPCSDCEMVSLADYFSCTEDYVAASFRSMESEKTVK